MIFFINWKIIFIGYSELAMKPYLKVSLLVLNHVTHLLKFRLNHTGKFIWHKCKIKIHSDTASLVINSDYIRSWFSHFLHWMLDIRWVHTSLVSRPQVYFNLTSDMNGSNSNLSSLLCSRGNVSCSKEPKYTSKSSSTHPYRRTYVLSKQFQEIECQSNALFDEISEHTRLVRHAHYFRTTCLLDAWLSRTWK